MKTLTIPQHIDGLTNPEWLAAWAGRVTASRIVDVMAKIKTGEAASRADYKAQIIAEILTGTPQGSTFINDEMRWGTEKEPEARFAYESEHAMVHEVGLVYHPTIERGAASPDGIVGTSGMVEFKCPKTATHLSTLLSGDAPKKYADNQCQWQMCCAGPEIEWCDFVSYDPRLPEEIIHPVTGQVIRPRLFVKRVMRDNARIAEIEAEVKQFLSEVEDMIEKLYARWSA